MAHRYFLNNSQANALKEDVLATGGRLMLLTFSDPADDEKTIRHAAYLRGRFDAQQEILADNFEDPPTDDTNQNQGN